MKSLVSLSTYKTYLNKALHEYNALASFKIYAQYGCTGFQLCKRDIQNEKIDFNRL